MEQQPDHKLNQTFFSKNEEEEKTRQWFLFDATGKTLGRFASEIAKVLRGKHKPTYTPHADTGAGVIVINADKIHVTGAKEARKIYYSHSRHIGGLKEVPYRTMKAKNPEYIIVHAVEGMLPRNRMIDKQLKKLRVFKGSDHGMEAQKPIKVNC